MHRAGTEAAESEAQSYMSEFICRMDDQVELMMLTKCYEAYEAPKY